MRVEFVFFYIKSAYLLFEKHSKKTELSLKIKFLTIQPEGIFVIV